MASTPKPFGFSPCVSSPRFAHPPGHDTHAGHDTHGGDTTPHLGHDKHAGHDPARTTARIGVLTVFAFSSENWSRPEDEVAGLMDLSDALAALNVARYAAWQPQATPANSKPAVLAFDGDVYDGLQAKGLAQLIVTMTEKKATVATISGYHSAAGTLTQNQELAKQRAFTVRDALLAAGIAESRVTLAKPQQTSGNVSGEDPSSRRVEVTVQ